jgi:hypothetical protein
MSDRQVPRESWPVFLDDFSREHAGSPVTVEMMAPDRGTQVEARGLPLGGVSVDLGEFRSEIVVSVGQRPSAHLTHHVPNPATVTLEEEADGTARALRIVSRGGDETVVRFRLPVAGEAGDVFFR